MHMPLSVYRIGQFPRRYQRQQTSPQWVRRGSWIDQNEVQAVKEERDFSRAKYCDYDGRWPRQGQSKSLLFTFLPRRTVSDWLTDQPSLPLRLSYRGRLAGETSYQVLS